jgi:hypothetical protein
MAYSWGVPDLVLPLLESQAPSNLMASIVAGMKMAPHRAFRATQASGMPTTVAAAMMPNAQLPVSTPRSTPATADPITTRRTIAGQAPPLADFRDVAITIVSTRQKQ